MGPKANRGDGQGVRVTATTTAEVLAGISAKSLAPKTQASHNANWRAFTNFCKESMEYMDPSTNRFPSLPDAIMHFVLVRMQGKVDSKGKIKIEPGSVDVIGDDGPLVCSKGVAEKIRSSIANYYDQEGCPVTELWRDVDGVCSGNPLSHPRVKKFFKGLGKEMKTHSTRRAAPMSPHMLLMIFEFLDLPRAPFAKPIKLWFKAVTSLAFYGCARISEV